tara:strand:+ start:460 stop:1089 length:630 start_codon:yes stop_codon:yes gene_type:complete
MNFNKIIKDTASYFSLKINNYKDVPLGVDWNSIDAQEIRQDQVLKILSTSKKFSINDIGCGYAHLFDYLKIKKYSDFKYYGIDISPHMIRQAEKRNKNTDINLRLINSINEIDIADYSVASGLFNMKQSIPNNEWQAYITECLVQINKKSEKGFSFNMLTSYADKKLMRPDLYYGDPLFYFDFCKKNFSNNISLLHDYGLYDFTILVRR